ncbi:hypothetical protein FFLO_02762 [Filobasidium floriforme]|uniref:Zinc finger protein 830 n=1 Tax=Filobasidium floriforme TaxID=5210 RepID=A0A8K0JM15_9TREE|nr:hypothetical protein FFLO_02762 [Filobasidium floriforme]
MSDARSLLRAHKAQAGSSQQVQDPHATTTAKGELRCSICVVSVKHWSAHTASKQHRTSLQRVKAEEDKAAAKAAKRRKPDPVSAQDVMEEGPAAVSGNDADDEERQTKRSKVDGLKTSGQAAPAPAIVDDELDSFLSSIAGIAADPGPSSASDSNPRPATKKAYKPSQPEAPTLYEAAPTLFVPDNGSTITAAPTSASNPFAGRLTAQTEGPVLPDAGVVEPEEEEETEAERHARAQREEREEIIDRLEEETRAQEDADDRVQTLKAKLEAVKRQRRERLAKKQQ